uniref:MGS-like domain-containing protein n=1 Tax=Brassica campestris TaxID=3711 RepID=M4CMD3_BRACM
MLSSAATASATSVSARSGDILYGYLRRKTVAPFRFAQPKQQVYCKSLRPSFVAVRAMSESQTALKNQPQSSASSGKKQALISLSDKKDLATLGNGLQELGYTIVSTGGTASTLENAGVSVTKVETLTHFPEMATLVLFFFLLLENQLDGRVKTLHPNIHGGILARRDVEHHMEALNEHGIGTFDVVVVNLYPFYNKVTAPGGISFEDGIENIDIGGPAMIRAAAKNHKDVLIVVDSEDYQAVLEYLKGGQSDQQFRRKLAWKAFQHVAAYDSAVSEWLWKQTEGKEKFPPSFTVPLSLKSSLRYGENPHQKAAFYVDKSLAEVNAGGIATAIQHHGKEMSYNNYLDADAAWNCVSEFENPTCVVVKHTNPCGVASRDDILEAYRLAVKADPVSAFGGIVAFNVEVDEVLARELREFRSPTDGETRMFYEIVVAPKYTAKGLEVLKGKSKTLRILEAKKNDQGKLSLRQVGGGWLAQDSDDITPEDISFKAVSDKTPTESELADAKFAWLCVKHVKSNAIVIAKVGSLSSSLSIRLGSFMILILGLFMVKNNCMLGMGSGQPNRVESLRLAFKKAGEEAKGAALASDAFFPFAWKDAVEEACEKGIGAIAEPGGSIRDQDAIDCCNKYGVSLLFTNVLLEKRNIQSIAERMQDYHAIAMVILFGPKLRELQKQVQENVKSMMSEELQISYGSRRHNPDSRVRNGFMKPEFIASCSTFGPEGKGVVVRIASDSTESVYNFLRQQLGDLEPLLGQSPYA